MRQIHEDVKPRLERPPERAVVAPRGIEAALDSSGEWGQAQGAPDETGQLRRAIEAELRRDRRSEDDRRRGRRAGAQTQPPAGAEENRHRKIAVVVDHVAAEAFGHDPSRRIVEADPMRSRIDLDDHLAVEDASGDGVDPGAARRRDLDRERRHRKRSDAKLDAGGEHASEDVAPAREPRLPRELGRDAERTDGVRVDREPHRQPRDLRRHGDPFRSRRERGLGERLGEASVPAPH